MLIQTIWIKKLCDSCNDYVNVGSPPRPRCLLFELFRKVLDVIAFYPIIMYFLKIKAFSPKTIVPLSHPGRWTVILMYKPRTYLQSNSPTYPQISLIVLSKAEPSKSYGLHLVVRSLKLVSFSLCLMLYHVLCSGFISSLFCGGKFFYALCFL